MELIISILSNSLTIVVSIGTICVFIYGAFRFIKSKSFYSILFDNNFNLLLKDSLLKKLFRLLLLNPNRINKVRVKVQNKSKKGKISSFYEACFINQTNSDFKEYEQKVLKCLRMLFSESAILSYRGNPKLLENLDVVFLNFLKIFNQKPQVVPFNDNTLSLDIFVNLNTIEFISITLDLSSQQKEKLITRKKVNNVDIFRIPQFLNYGDIEQINSSFDIDIIIPQMLYHAVQSDYFGLLSELSNSDDIDKLFSKYDWNVGLH